MQFLCDKNWFFTHCDWPCRKVQNDAQKISLVWVLGTFFENFSKCRIWYLSILPFSTNFCPIKSYLSGNTFWPQVSIFPNFFGIFNRLLSTQNVNMYSSPAMLNETFFMTFKHSVHICTFFNAYFYTSRSIFLRKLKNLRFRIVLTRT